MNAYARDPEETPPSNHDIMARLNLLVDKVEWIAARVSNIERASASFASQSPDAKPSPSRPASREVGPASQKVDGDANGGVRVNPDPKAPAAAKIRFSNASAALGRSESPKPPDRAQVGARPAPTPRPQSALATPSSKVFDDAPGHDHANRGAAPQNSTDYAPASPSEPASQATATRQSQAHPGQNREEANRARLPAHANRTPPPTGTFSPQPRSTAQSFWQRLATERQLGRYLLSFAAALLIFMAGASLIALLWNDIPNYVKVLVVGVIGLAFTGIGALLCLRPKGNRLAAATVMGTGGGLVYVALIGAVLLDGVLHAEPAFMLLTVWSILLAILAVKTRNLFTMFIVGAGGIVSVILANSYAYDNPKQALVAAWAMSLHAGCLAVACAGVAQAGASEKKAAYVTPSLAVSIAALVASPFEQAAESSFWSAGLALVLPVLLVFLQFGFMAHWIATIEPSYARSLTIGWLGADSLAVIVLLRLYQDAPEGYMWDNMWKFLLVIAVPLATTLIVTVAPVNRDIAISAGVTSSICTIALGLFCQSTWSEHPALLWIPAVAVAVNAAPSLKHRDFLPALIAPFALLATANHEPGEPDEALLSLLAAAIVIVTMAVTSARSKDRYPLTISTWLMALVFVIAIPLNLTDLLAISGVGQSWSLAALFIMVDLAAALLILAGLPTNVTPSELLAGRGFGRRPTLAAPGRAGDSPRPAIPVETIAVSLIGLGLQGLPLAPLNIGAPDILPRLAFVAAFVALGGAIVWLVWPVIRSSFGGAVVGATTTIVFLGTTSLLSKNGPASASGTIAFVLAGATCVSMGFMVRSKMLRQYGLAIILIMVVKFAAVDISGRNSVVRVLALALAGMVCFALSLAYARFSSILEPKDVADADQED